MNGNWRLIFHELGKIYKIEKFYEFTKLKCAYQTM